MQYSMLTLIAALAGNALAQVAGFNPITAPIRDEVLTAGSNYVIQWTPEATYNADTITIQLMAGASNLTLDITDAIASSISSSAGKYEWAIPTSLKQANTYGFKLVLDKDNSIYQFSNPFSIKFGAGSSSTSEEATYGEPKTAATTTTTAATTSTEEPVYGEKHSQETSSSSSSSTSVPSYGKDESSSTTESTEPSVPTTPSYNNNTDYELPTEAAPTTLIPVGTGTAAPSGTGAINPTTTPITAGAGAVGAPLALLAGVAALML
ncbi:hypothetical protein CFIMG_008062RA00001 [Ceratocystis fimbriata CBS 114723]|uniref:Yeast cell wall synthesis Kre9/Knh1-like N-terminal domain-containing protein n=1 Tax=Ceratocystis fimbriata CBS 114723 TaxID=1035309 RepID=A0A2C5X9E5_9PEZI|nr:hypothetical protein CFIMG_008062RA00001 [Ceratocystis fimbriata CBS 114723]